MLFCFQLRIFILIKNLTTTFFIQYITLCNQGYFSKMRITQIKEENTLSCATLNTLHSCLDYLSLSNFITIHQSSCMPISFSHYLYYLYIYISWFHNLNC